MKREFKAITATTNIDSDGDQLTEENLHDMAGLPIHRKVIKKDFDNNHVIGIILESKVENSKLISSGEIEDGYEDYYIVPSGMIQRDDKGNIENVILAEFGCTKRPSDKSLTPLQYIDKQETE